MHTHERVAARGLAFPFPSMHACFSGQDWPTGEGPHGDWLHETSDALTAKGIDHDASEEEGDIHSYKHGHGVAKMRLRNNPAQILEAGRWIRTTLNMGTGPGQVPGKVQFKLVTTDAGGVDGVRQCTFKNPDQLDTGRFRWISNRGAGWDQVSAWGAEWRWAHDGLLKIHLFGPFLGHFPASPHLPRAVTCPA